MAHGLTQAERRCTIAHETEHIMRGVVPDWCWPREERAVDRAASRKLITIAALADALAWTQDPAEAAEELWVDVAMLLARLANLTEAEGRELSRRLDLIELGMPEDEVTMLSSCVPRTHFKAIQGPARSD